MQNQTVKIQVLTPEAFAPFGHVLAPNLDAPDFAGPGYSTWRFPLELDGRPDLTVIRHQFRPLACKRLERHGHITETRLPLDARSSLVFVAATPDAPNPDEVVGFYVPGDTGIIIGRNVWHSSSFPMDALGAQWVLISDRETEAELEAAGLTGRPEIYTQVCDWDGAVSLIPDLSALGQPFDRDR